MSDALVVTPAFDLASAPAVRRTAHVAANRNRPACPRRLRPAGLRRAARRRADARCPRPQPLAVRAPTPGDLLQRRLLGPNRPRLLAVPSDPREGRAYVAPRQPRQVGRPRLTGHPRRPDAGSERGPALAALEEVAGARACWSILADGLRVLLQPTSLRPLQADLRGQR